MFDSDICALVDPAGTPWFATVLGMSREVRGLALYRGGRGLRTLQAFLGDPDPEVLQDLTFRQDALTVWFGAKHELPAAQRESYAALGYRPARGTKWAWPCVLDHTPGYQPWGPTAGQVAWLAAAIPAVLGFAMLIRQEPRIAANRGHLEFPTVPVGAPIRSAGDLEWRHWSVQPEAPCMDPVRFADAPLATRLRALPVAAGQGIDLGWFFSPDCIAEGDRPYHGRILALLDPTTACCLAMNVIPIHDDLAGKAGELLVGQFVRGRAIPATVRVQDPELAGRLGPWLAELGCRIERAERLPSLAALRQALAVAMAR